MRGRPKRSVDVTFKCRQCGVNYSRPSWQSTGRTFCSMTCCHAAKRGKPRPAHRVEPDTVICGACRQPFLVGGRGRRQRKAKFCSRRCHGIGQSSQPDVREMSDTEIAWLAGLFDGEGNIAWPRKGNVHTVRVSIANTCFPLLDRLIVVTGTGSIITKKLPSNPRHAKSGNWTCCGERAKTILRLMLPWLIVKRENAEIVLEAAQAKLEGAPSPRQPLAARWNARSTTAEDGR